MDRITENQAYETACTLCVVIFVYLMYALTVFSTSAAFATFTILFLLYCFIMIFELLTPKFKKEDYNHGMKKD
jgi:flagellar biosynthesis protein FlhB